MRPELQQELVTTIGHEKAMLAMQSQLFQTKGFEHLELQIKSIKERIDLFEKLLADSFRTTSILITLRKEPLEDPDGCPAVTVLAATDDVIALVINPFNKTRPVEAELCRKTVDKETFDTAFYDAAAQYVQEGRVDIEKLQNEICQISQS